MSEQLWQRGQDIAERVLDLIFPPRCPGCDRSGSIMCASCIEQCVPVGASICLRCGIALPASGLCRKCKFYPPGLSGLRAACVYQGVLRSCIHALKYEGNKRLAGPLGLLLAQAYWSYRLRADMIVPIPLHEERERQRGYNQSRLLASVCAAALGVPVRDDVVTRWRETPAQVELPASERRRSVAGAFRLVPLLPAGSLYGCSILLMMYARPERRWRRARSRYSRLERRQYGRWRWHGLSMRRYDDVTGETQECKRTTFPGRFRQSQLW